MSVGVGGGDARPMPIAFSDASVVQPTPWRQRTSTAIGLALAYALLVTVFPWEALSRSGFSDFHDYVEYFDYFYVSNDLSAAEVYGGLTTVREFFVREVLWFELVRWLTKITADVGVALRVLSFFMMCVWAVFLLKRTSFSIALLFLVNPTAIDVAMSSIKNGLAWSLIMLAILTRARILKLALAVTAAFIHSSTVALIVLYGATALFRHVRTRATLLAGALSVGAAAGLTISVGTSVLAAFFEGRRSGAEYLVGRGSYLQASVWGGLLLLQCTASRAYIRRHLPIVALLAWFLVTNLFIPWSYRIWGCWLPVIAVSALELPSGKRKLFMASYAVYLVLQYVYWTPLLNLVL